MGYPIKATLEAIKYDDAVTIIDYYYDTYIDPSSLCVIAVADDSNSRKVMHSRARLLRPTLFTFKYLIRYVLDNIKPKSYDELYEQLSSERIHYLQIQLITKSTLFQPRVYVRLCEHSGSKENENEFEHTIDNEDLMTKIRDAMRTFAKFLDLEISSKTFCQILDTIK